MTEGTKSASPGAMSATERNTLIRITKQRFKLLHQGLYARTQQLETQIRKEVLAENEDKIEAAKQKVEDEVIEPMRALYEQYVELIGDLYDQEGLTFDSAYGSMMGKRPSVRAFDDGVGAYIGTRFSPKDLNQEVQDRLDAIIGDKPVTKYQLEVEEARILEDILVGNLQSGDAKNYLDRVPTLESLIPLANGNGSKAIEA